MLDDWEYYTIITNKDKKWKKWSLCSITRSTKSSLVSESLSWINPEIVPVEIKYKVKEITLDLDSSMDMIARTNFPNALIVADRFHFQKVITESLQELRIKAKKEALEKENNEILEIRKYNLELKQKIKKIKEKKKQEIKEKDLEKENNKNLEKKEYKAKVFSNWETEKQLLTRSRYLLYKLKNKWKEKEIERAKILFENYPEIEKAYNLTMYFRWIFEYSKTLLIGKERLYKWYEKVKESWINELISSSKTIKANEWKILNYFDSRASNASAENFNAKIKWFRANLRWINDFNFFLFRLENLYA